MLTIMTESNATKVDRHHLPHTVTTPRGDRSNRWQGIPHWQLVQHLRRELTNAGFDIIEERLYTSRVKEDRDARLTGGYIFNLPFGGLDQPVRYSMGFTHDNASGNALRIYTGASVTFCDNGYASCELESRRRHTTGLQLGGYIRERVGQMGDDIGRIAARMATLKSEGINTTAKHNQMLTSAARRGIISWSMAGEFDRMWFDAATGLDCAWERPEYAGRWPFECNAWDWLNVGTHLLKKLSPQSQLPRLRKLEEHVYSHATAA